MMIRDKVMLLGALLLGTALYGQSLQSVLPELHRSEQQAVESTQRISNKVQRYRDVRMIPRIPELEQAVDRTLRSAKPNVVNESLLLISKQATPEAVRYFYNSFRQVGRLAEVEYHNPDHGRDHQIFDFSHHVSDAESEEILADPVVAEREALPGEDSIYVWQYLLPFDDMHFRYTYRLSPGMLRISVENVSPLQYKFLNIINEGSFVTELALIFGDDYLLFYGVGGVRVFNPFNILGDKIDPFYYRIDGIFDWYNQNYLQPWLREEIEL